jgi:hypothetical protein
LKLVHVKHFAFTSVLIYTHDAIHSNLNEFVRDTQIDNNDIMANSSDNYVI